MRQTLSDLRHVTWKGRIAWVWYRLRGAVVDPAPDGERCVMGWPLGKDHQCPRRIERKGGLWCARHDDEVAA